MYICRRAADTQSDRNFHLPQTIVLDRTPSACSCFSVISELACWELATRRQFTYSLIRRDIFRDSDSSVSNFGLEADIFRAFVKSS